MRAGIALGTNLGDRIANLRLAGSELLKLHHGSEPALFSKIYETEPVDCEPGSTPYLNAVAEIEFNGPPVFLLDALQEIEAAMGRPSKRPRNAPRPIDLDILYAGNLTLSNQEIVIPHPRLHLRRFVLLPLSDIRPDLVLPGYDRTVGDLLSTAPEINGTTIQGVFLTMPKEGSFDQEVRAKKGREKLAVLTAYDYPLARLLDECGIDLILVGDSLGMVVLGYPDTTAVTIDDVVHHCRAAARGVTNAWVIADLPFGTYESPEDAVKNGARLREAGANAVKLEGGTHREAQIRALVQAGIPVVGHIGMLPQHVLEEGGYKMKGKTPEAAHALIEEGLAIQRAGASAIVLELVTPLVTKELTATLAIPTIGIGSGPDCDGQVLVTHDLIGLFPWFKPKFATRKADVAALIHTAVKAYAAEVKGT